MSEVPIIDVHMHVYHTKEEGIADKAAYELWEYGETPPEVASETALIDAPGIVDDLIAALDEAGASKGVVLNVFSSAGLYHSGMTDPTELADKYIESNLMFCQLLDGYDRLIPFISVDPIINILDDPREYLRDMVENHGARGAKIHPNLQSVHLQDPKMLPVWEACVEFNLPVLTHSGACRGNIQFAEPNSFVETLSAFPDLKLIVAHLGGAAWQQTSALAQKFPNIAFDLCEHLLWTGAEHAASIQELARLILEGGPERVMLGSDFPWYTIAHHVERVMELPLLSKEQKERILGRNAMAYLNL
jgi:uncharacterized protein